MSDRVWPVILASAAVTAGLVALLPGDDDGGSTVAPSEDPVAAFVAAFERSRTATFAADQVFTRTSADGEASISYDRRLVQRPPDDRIVVGGGAAEGRLDGRVLRCFTPPAGESRCDQGPPAPDYAEEVAAEVRTLRDLVEGDRPVYLVAEGEPGCWSLQLHLDVASPPYGRFAGFCFDEATGAPTRFEVRREEATDVVETTAIRPDVTAADVRPGDLGELPGT